MPGFGGGHSGFIHLDGCDILQVTEKAVLIRYDGEKHWIPKSQMAYPDDFEPGDVDLTVSVTEWIAEQKGILV